MKRTKINKKRPGLPHLNKQTDLTKDQCQIDFVATLIEPKWPCSSGYLVQMCYASSCAIPILEINIVMVRPQAEYGRRLENENIRQPILKYFVRGIITVQLTSSFTCLDSAVLVMLN